MDTFVVIANTYDDLDDALADYEAARHLYLDWGVADTYDAATVVGTARSARGAEPTPERAACLHPSGVRSGHGRHRPGWVNRPRGVEAGGRFVPTSATPGARPLRGTPCDLGKRGSGVSRRGSFCSCRSSCWLPGRPGRPASCSAAGARTGSGAASPGHWRCPAPGSRWRSPTPADLRRWPSATGLSAFGALAEATGSFAVAARLLGGFAALSALGFGALPETRGTELETSKRIHRSLHLKHDPFVAWSAAPPRISVWGACRCCSSGSAVTV
jgi:hypothetical protein